MGHGFVLVGGRPELSWAAYGDAVAPTVGLFERERWEVRESYIPGLEAHTAPETLTWFSPPVVAVSRDVTAGKNPASRSHSAIDQAQGAMAAHQLKVKVINHVAPENCVHKYLRINLSMTAAKLKDQALEAFNVGRSGYNSAIFASYFDASTTPYEIKLADDDRPFLLALYFASLEEQKAKTGDAKLTADTYLYALPRVLSLPIGPEKIPVTFSVRQVKPEVKKVVELQVPEVVVESPERPSRRRSRERPFSTLYDGRSTHLHGLKGLRSQSSYNLAELPSSKGDYDRRGRSKSRPRLAKVGHFSRFRCSADTRSATRQSVIFGQLPQDIWPDCHVSMSIMSLFVTVFYKGSLIEGIFRKSAMKSHQELMVLRVDSDDDPLSVQDCPPLLAASTLKVCSHFFSCKHLSF
ncbi:unnamed protein product [Schistocephalus solidus]|uniref:Uncharacterized protein n=1 Tax=Schistocephalus solidus TaxID=70667 RepID=A0A183T7V9_SCHSO|nr:unnamed protein product [Schistocephalus solidus]